MIGLVSSQVGASCRILDSAMVARHLLLLATVLRVLGIILAKLLLTFAAVVAILSI